MIPIYDKNTHQKRAYLDRGIVDDSFRITRTLNGETTATFQYMPQFSEERGYVDMNPILTAPAYIEVDGLLFDIAYIEQTHANSMEYRIDCEHVTYRLHEVERKQVEYSGTLSEILAKILAGTDIEFGGAFAGEKVGGIYTFKGKPDKDGNFPAGNDHTFPEMESNTALGQIRELANAVQGGLYYNGFAVGLWNTFDTDRNYVIRYGKNITGITRFIDWRKNLIYYSVDVVLLKKLSFEDEPYIPIEHVEEGDLVRVIDEELGIDSRIRVASRTYDPIGEVLLSIKLANNIETFADDLDELRGITNRIIRSLAAVIIECTHVSTVDTEVTVRIDDSSITSLQRHGTYQFNIAYPIPNNAIIRLTTFTGEILASRPWMYQNNRPVRLIDFAVGARVQVMDSGASFFSYALFVGDGTDKVSFQIAVGEKTVRKIAIIGNTVAFRGDL